MKTLSVIALSLVLLAACQNSDDLASPSSSYSVDQRSQSRDFQASLSSSVNPGNPLTVCSGDIPEFGIPDHFLDGQAKHLGNLNGDLSTLHHDDCNISFATAELTTSVSGQLAAANGDLLFYSGVDVIDISVLLGAPGSTGSIEGTWTIDGGTGRFEEASGSFTISGVVDFVTGTFTADANGTITY